MAKQPYKQEVSDVYKKALETVLKMIQDGIHVEQIMKFIKSML